MSNNLFISEHDMEIVGIERDESVRTYVGDIKKEEVIIVDKYALSEVRVCCLENYRNVHNILYNLISIFLWAETIAYVDALTNTNTPESISTRCGAPWINIQLVALLNVATAINLYFSNPSKHFYSGEVFTMYMRPWTIWCVVLNNLFRFWSLVVYGYLHNINMPDNCTATPNEDACWKSNCMPDYLDNILFEAMLIIFVEIGAIIILGIVGCAMCCHRELAEKAQEKVKEDLSTLRKNEEKMKDEITNLKEEVKRLHEEHEAIPVVVVPEHKDADM